MATAITERPTEPRRQSGHYRAYTPRPFTRAERDSVTILFGGLHWAGVNTGVVSARRGH